MSTTGSPIVLDPFFDHRNGFFFQVNPAGARADGQVSNNSRAPEPDWDGIWNAAARISDEGWIAEIEIPFKTLRFKPGQTVWGFNVERQIKRRQEIGSLDGGSAEHLDWQSGGSRSPRRSRRSTAGTWPGRPAVCSPVEKTTAMPTLTGGVDCLQNLTPNLNAAVSVNTDFAETEADLRQVNLTRFPLFFPEKRAFFLEGAGVFDVAGLANTTDIRPFFSRRVGLRRRRQRRQRDGAAASGSS